MSQAAPPKNNLMQMVLIFAVIFLGFQLFFGQKGGNSTETRTADQIMASIQKEASDIQANVKKLGKPVNVQLTEMSSSSEPDLLKPWDKFSPDQDWQQLLILDSLECDMAAPIVEQQYEKAVNGTVGFTKQQKEDRALQGQMLVAHTQLKAASHRQEITRITLANDTVTRLQRYNDTKPVWNQPITVTANEQYPQTQMTPAEITVKVDQVSSDLGKNTPVWGFFPGYQIIDFIVHLTGAIPGFSYWFGCLLLAVTVRAIIWPLSQRQMMWSRQMSQLTPLIKEIKEQYKNDQVEMNNRTMALYKEYGMNPMAGCWPAFLQMPLFLLVYQSMLHYRFEFQKGTFAWISPGMSNATHGFIARNLGEKDYILIIFYGISMITTAFLAPISDPSNVKQQRTMGVSMSAFFGVMMFFWPVPSAFILYWTFTNILATTQSLRAYRLPLPPLVKKNAPNGGVFPTANGGGKFGVSKDGLPSSATNGKLNGKPKSTGAPKIHKPKKKK